MRSPSSAKRVEMDLPRTCTLTRVGLSGLRGAGRTVIPVARSRGSGEKNENCDGSFNGTGTSDQGVLIHEDVVGTLIGDHLTDTAT